LTAQDGRGKYRPTISALLGSITDTLKLFFRQRNCAILGVATTARPSHHLQPIIANGQSQLKTRQWQRTLWPELESQNVLVCAACLRRLDFFLDL